MQTAQYIAYAIVREESLDKTGWRIHHTRICGVSIQNRVEPAVKITSEYEGVYIQIWEEGKHSFKKSYIVYIWGINICKYDWGVI